MAQTKDAAIVPYEDPGEPITVDGESDDDFLARFQASHQGYKRAITANPNASKARKVEAEVGATVKSLWNAIADYGNSLNDDDEDDE